VSESKRAGRVDRRIRGLAMADALLKQSRSFQPLGAAAHQRVRRRLRLSNLDRTGRRKQRLRSVVLAVAMLFSGTAFGVALNQLIIAPRAAQALRPGATDGRAAGRARGKRHQGAASRERSPSSDVQAAAAPVELPQQVPASSPVAEPAQQAHPVEPVTAALPPTTLRLPAPPAREPVRLALASPRLARTSLPPTVQAEPPQPVARSLETAGMAPRAFAWRSRSLEPAHGDPRGTTEEQLLSIAVRALRVGHDPLTALAALDDYQARHRNGRLSVEAAVLRAEALTAVGRATEALRDLDAVDLGRMPGAVARRLERGELREGAGQLANALADFDWVLAHAQDPAFVEAALGGRIRCRQLMGDVSGARADAAEYLRRFPVGSSARQASAIVRAGSRTWSP
jgi:hypothetical protein